MSGGDFVPVLTLYPRKLVVDGVTVADNVFIVPKCGCLMAILSNGTAISAELKHLKEFVIKLIELKLRDIEGLAMINDNYAELARKYRELIDKVREGKAEINFVV